MSDDEVAINLSFGEGDAAFIEAMQRLDAEPLFLGEYIPQYDKSQDMKSLTWTSASPMANYEVELGFTLADGHITALFLDLREQSEEICEVVANNLSKLKELKELVIGLSETQIMPKIGSLTKLQYLEVIKERKPIKLPSLKKLKELNVLVISGKIEVFPDLSRQVNLQRLIMRWVASADFPESILGLDNLVWLELGNQFVRVPDEIVTLENLIVLDLVSDNLEYLPDDLGKLSKLQHLSLETDKIETLPSTFDQFELMTDLYLWNFPFTELPGIICNLKNLRYLWLKENSKLRGALISIPDEIGQLTNLVDLQINGHLIEEIPETIGNLEKLEMLNLGINKIKVLPKSLITLSNLKRLEIYLNPIQKLPKNIGDLENLNYLDVSDTKITKLPKSIARIRNLTDFDAIGCDIVTLPESIAGWNFTKFKSFLITLRDTPESLPSKVQDWLNKLVRYADENSENQIEVEISLYVPETEDKYE